MIRFASSCVFNQTQIARTRRKILVRRDIDGLPVCQLAGLALIVGVPLAACFLVNCAVRHIPNNRVGIVEKLWSSTGSLGEGNLIATDGKAGYQARLLRGGVHVGYWRWQYRIHKVPLVTVKQGCIADVFARDGLPLDSGQTLGRVVDSNNFQDAEKFLVNDGQKGRQRAILREGVYPINLRSLTSSRRTACFISETNVRHARRLAERAQGDRRLLPRRDRGPARQHRHRYLPRRPVAGSGEIIAPPVSTNPEDPDFHNNYQDPEAFLRAGGRRGRQYTPLTDGTYFINRWFATVELIDKKIVPIGFVGVVVSYYGLAGRDLRVTNFRHGERVQEGERGVWAKCLGPGKYPFNTYAGSVVLCRPRTSCFTGSRGSRRGTTTTIT